MNNIKLISSCALISFITNLLLFSSIYAPSLVFYQYEPTVYAIKQPEIKPVLLDDTKRQVDCLAKNIYFEARSESHEGQLAVAQVTMNRVHHPNYPKDICDVVYQKTVKDNKIVCQFSWTCYPNIVTEVEAWQTSLMIAKKALTDITVHDKLARTNALFYHSLYVKPNWKFTRVSKIGNHIFYAELHN